MTGLDASREQMKPAESNLELVRLHKKNLRIRKPLHPAYLDVSTKAVAMLDHTILTFVYVGSLRHAGQSVNDVNNLNMNNMNSVNTSINNINTTIMMITC